MIRHIIVIAAALLAPAASAADSDLPDTISWTIDADSDAAPADRVQFTLSYRAGRSQGNWSNTTDLGELQGLEAAELSSAQSTPVRFRITREAGRFDCEGVVRQRRGSGDCRFEADTAFASALSARGIGAPSRLQHYQLALARVGMALIEELDRQNYARPSVDDLVSAGIHRADAAYIRAMAEAGYRVGTVDGLVRMRIHRVTPDYVAALAAAGYRPDADTAVQMRIHGVTPDYIQGVARAGGGRFTQENLIAMRIHGVSPEFVSEMSGLGYRDLSADQLTSMRIHGVTGAFVRRALDGAPSRPSPEELVSRRIHGGV